MWPSVRGFLPIKMMRTPLLLFSGQLKSLFFHMLLFFRLESYISLWSFFILSGLIHQTVHIQPVHWFHILWSLAAFQFMCKLRGMQFPVLTWRSENPIKDSWCPCLRVVRNHEANQDLPENVSYLLDLCVQKGNDSTVVHFIHHMFRTSLILFAVCLYCSLVQFGFSTRSCFSSL